MAKIVTFGELMYRISPEGENRLFQTRNFTMTPGGAEANVAVSLANYGEKTLFVTALPANPIAEALKSQLRSFGVDDSRIVTFGDRVGLYYAETGSNMRPSKVVYDRKGSAAAECPPENYNWEKILAGARWFHTTGITPAISRNAWKAAMDALETCKKLGVTVSCDLNFRKKLWKWGREPGEVMPEITRYADYLIANEEDCQNCLGIEFDSDIEGGSLDADSYKKLGGLVLSEYPNLKTVAFSLRESKNADFNKWSGIAVTHDSSFISRKYEIRNIVDRIGGGDAFSAGLIYGYLHFAADLEKTINFAVAASALKHTLFGDFNRVTLEEVMSLTDGHTSGRIKR